LAAQSIQWGAWQSTGLVTDEKGKETVEVYRQMGIEAMTAEEALNCLGQIIVSGRTDVLVSPFSSKQFSRSFANAAPPSAFLSLLPKAGGSRMPENPESISEDLLALEPARRLAALESHLQEKVAAVLKTQPARIDPGKPFGAMGMDSLMGLEFVRRLSATTGLRLPVTAVFNYPTVQTLAREIARRMGIPLESAAPAEVGTAGKAMQAAVSSVADMTDDQAIEALLRGGQRTI
jgi:acyl carrier protein